MPSHKPRWTEAELAVVDAAPWWTVAAEQLPQRSRSAVLACWRSRHSAMSMNSARLRPPLEPNEMLFWQFFLWAADQASVAGRRLDVSGLLEALHHDPDWRGLVQSCVTDGVAGMSAIARLEIASTTPIRIPS